MEAIQTIPEMAWWWLALLLFDGIVLLGVHLPLLLKLRKKEKQTKTTALPPLSIIIAARNEADNLLNLIPKLFSQEYHQFEVIVVDDCSYDGTHDVLLAFNGKYPNFKYSRVQESRMFQGGKKFALTMGIKAAQYEHCVFIDADCWPNTSKWLQGYGEAFAKGNALVLGHGAYQKQKGFLNAWIRYEADQIAVKYFSLTQARIRYMGVGRNMGYTKTLFFDNKGFSKHLHIKSGDDDLFINQLPAKTPVGLLTDRSHITLSKAKNHFWEWFHQKRRHVSTARYYTPKVKVTLSILALSKLFLVLLFCYQLIVFPSYWYLSVLATGWFFASRWMWQWPLIKRIGNTSLLFLNWLFEPLLWLYYLTIPIFTFFKREIHWKN